MKVAVTYDGESLVLVLSSEVDRELEVLKQIEDYTEVTTHVQYKESGYSYMQQEEEARYAVITLTKPDETDQESPVGGECHYEEAEF